MHWKNTQILWCLWKYIYLPLKIHSYVLIYICIPSKYITIPSKYIIIPSKYITIPSKNLTYFWHILQYHYYIPISFHILPYTLKLSWDLSMMHFFVLSQTLFFKTVLAPHYSTKMSCTCHDMFIGIQKWSIFYEFHKSYWLIKYLNSKLISWDPINTCWTYIR
jgi:hypothetical protein